MQHISKNTNITSRLNEKMSSESSIIISSTAVYSNSTPIYFSPTDPVTASQGPYVLDNREISRAVFSSLIVLAILICSAVPAAAIWRNNHLHRPSFYYVMVLCLLDCFLGCSIGAMLVTIVTMWGVSNVLCIVFEVLVNSTLNAISVVMLALSRDRFLSLKDPIEYRATMRSSVVWRHLALALLYGLLHGGVMWVGSRLYFGGLTFTHGFCDAFDWLLDPKYRPLALITVGGSILFDIGTIVYNANIMHYAWKAKQAMVEGSAQRTLTEEAQRRRNMKMVVFTFKLACLFLGCSLPYKLALLLYGLGIDTPRVVLEILSLVRILYHIVDGWMVCANEELLEAIRAMVCQHGVTD